MSNDRAASNGSLIGRTLHIPRMGVEGAGAAAAAFRALGINGQVAPESNARTLELARQHTNGDECYPELVTLGNFLSVIEDPGFDPARTAFFMPTAGGPCRFGQYRGLLEKTLQEKGLQEVMVVSPTSADGYAGVGEQAGDLVRILWWAIVCSDGLRKLLLQTRPYEETPGETDAVHAESLASLCRVLERQEADLKVKFSALVEVMDEIGKKFFAIPARYERQRPLVGVVGEIYCRLDDFANADLVRRIEKFGGEARLASVAEWVFNVNFSERMNHRFQGNTLSKAMLGAVVRNRIQLRDEHRLLAPLAKRFRGYDEPESTKKLVEPAIPYLPYWGSLGEMVLSVGGAIFLHGKGADGIIDISPFSCMNGIICEAIYPRVSQDLDNLPIRIFYFDGTEGDYDRDVEIFLELARTYKKRKKVDRAYPDHFPA